jgi:GH25 family lysozyme M1 (1,4-beta-N-acetylmuramidase)
LTGIRDRADTLEHMHRRFPGLILALTLVVGAVTTQLAPAVATAGTATNPRGIDISHWQGDIDWAAVAGDGVDFAIMKATEGNDYTDTKFKQNRTNAQLAGVTIGMYHVASPRRSTDDARAEADRFLRVAKPNVGNLIPTLDIEIANVPDGMSSAVLAGWVRAWLNRVTAKLGVRPMIYGSQHMFEQLLGNSTWFADNGFPLWFAWPRKNLPSPLPANDWQGHSWTFWQWTWEGQIAGISGNVDRDRFANPDLRTATIASVTAQPGAGGSIADATGRVACGAGVTCSALFSPTDTVQLTATPDAGFAFVSWGGACASFGSNPTCSITALGSKTVSATFSYSLTVHVKGAGRGSVISSPAGVDCPGDCSGTFGPGASVTLTASPDQWSGLTWSGDCSGTDPNGCTVTMDQHRDVTATFTDLAAPTAKIKAPGSRAGPVTVTFDEPVHHVTTHNVVLRPSGGAPVAARLRCFNAAGDRTSCLDGRVRRAELQPRTTLRRGTTYAALVDPAGVPPIVDRAGERVALTRKTFSFG